jgi:hypothetical protein
MAERIVPRGDVFNDAADQRHRCQVLLIRGAAPGTNQCSPHFALKLEATTDRALAPLSAGQSALVRLETEMQRHQGGG